jgi:hypothetical protein
MADTGSTSQSDAPKSGEVLPAKHDATTTPVVPLDRLIEVGRPLLQDFLHSQERAQREDRGHEWRLAQLDAHERQRSTRWLYPLLYATALTVGFIAILACFRDKWEIATHLIAVLIGWIGGAGFVYQHQRHRAAEADPSDG